eukprot:1888624-Pleurochrysis_carterae.AAC.1
MSMPLISPDSQFQLPTARLCANVQVLKVGKKVDSCRPGFALCMPCVHDTTMGSLAGALSITRRLITARSV